MGRMLTPTETCQILKVSEPTLRAWAAAGTFPAYRVGSQWRFNEDEVHAWLAARANAAPHLAGLVTTAGAPGMVTR